MSVSMDNLPTIPLEKVQARLAALWLAGSGAIVLLLIAFSIIGETFEGHVQELWNWALPNFLPTLSLMISVLAAEAFKSTTSSNRVRRSFANIATWLSLFYLLLAPLTLLVHPFSRLEALELLSISNFWLGPLQGLVDAALAVVFLSKRRAYDETPHAL